MRRQDAQVLIRMLHKEKEALQKKADRCSLSVSEYLRRLARGVKPKEFPPGDYARILQEMKSINEKLFRMMEWSGDALYDDFLQLIKSYNIAIGELTKRAYGDEDFPIEELL